METRGFSDTQAERAGPAGLNLPLLAERWYPWAAALLCTLALAGVSGGIDVPDRVFDPVTAFASIMAGFVSTLLGILFSIRDTGRIRLLRSSGHFRHLKDYLYMAVLSSMALAALGVFAVATTDCTPCLFYELLRVLWVYLVFAAFFTCFRAITLIHRLL